MQQAVSQFMRDIAGLTPGRVGVVVGDRPPGTVEDRHGRERVGLDLGEELDGVG